MLMKMVIILQEEYQRNDKEPIGIHLVFEYPQPVIEEDYVGIKPRFNCSTSSYKRRGIIG